MLPLGLLTAGEKGEVMEESGIHEQSNCQKTIHCKRNSHCRISDMGIRTGKVIEMLNNEGKGPLLVKVDNSRLAIGRKMAMKIMVRRSES